MPNLADHLFARSRDSADKTALVFGEQSHTFAELAAAVRRVAGGLAALGVSAGSRVGLMAPASPEFIVTQQALFSLGATFTPLNICYRPHDLAHVVESCGLQQLVMAPEFVDRAPPAGAPEAKMLERIIILGGDSGGGGGDPRMTLLSHAVVASEPLAALVDLPEEAVGLMLNTSATTGRSKAVMLTLANLRANYDRTPDWLGLGRKTVTLCALPLYNTFGLNQCINASVATGGELVLLPRFDAGACIAEIARRRCTFLPAVPTMLQKILDHSAADRAALGSIN